MNQPETAKPESARIGALERGHRKGVRVADAHMPHVPPAIEKDADAPPDAAAELGELTGEFGAERVGGLDPAPSHPAQGVHLRPLQTERVSRYRCHAIEYTAERRGAPAPRPGPGGRHGPVRGNDSSIPLSGFSPALDTVRGGVDPFVRVRRRNPHTPYKQETHEIDRIGQTPPAAIIHVKGVPPAPQKRQIVRLRYRVRNPQHAVAVHVPADEFLSGLDRV